MRMLAKGVAALLFTVGAMVGAPLASADPGYGFPANCDTVPIGFFKAKLRTVCDTPIRPDGSWSRKRVFWIPALRRSRRVAPSGDGAPEGGVPNRVWMAMGGLKF